MDDWNQLRDSGFPVDRVWEQGMPLCDSHGQEERGFSYSLMNVGYTSQASEVETQEGIVQELDVDHTLLVKPTLQAVCWLVDLILSTNQDLQVEMRSKPTMNTQSIELMIVEVQTQIQELSSWADNSI